MLQGVQKFLLSWPIVLNFLGVGASQAAQRILRKLLHTAGEGSHISDTPRYQAPLLSWESAGLRLGRKLSGLIFLKNIGIRWEIKRTAKATRKLLFFLNHDLEEVMVPWLGHQMGAGSGLRADGPLTLAVSGRAKGCPIDQCKGNFSHSAIRSHVWPTTSVHAIFMLSRQAAAR